MRLFATASVLAAVAGSAAAGTVQISNTLYDNADLVSNYQALVGGGLDVRVNHIDGVAGNAMNFANTEHLGFGNGLFNVNVTANDAGNFFLGDVANLDGGNNNIWFDGGGLTRPDNGTFVLAFGNNSAGTNSNDVTLGFVPGVTAFGFNYDDLESATLTVTFTDTLTGVLLTEVINANSAQGFISFVAGAGETINSITLTQNEPSLDDGFSFYGFQTVQVIPLPPAAFAGLGLLGAMGIARRIRKA